MNGHDLEPHDEALERRAREAFEGSVARLDEDTRSRLREARRAAVDAFEARRRPAWQGWVPVAMAASALLVAVLLWRAPGEAPGPVVQSGGTEAIEALEVVAAGDDLDLVAEDLEFYAWLEQADFDGNAAGQG
jgi:hypothetical protein